MDKLKLKIRKKRAEQLAHQKSAEVATQKSSASEEEITEETAATKVLESELDALTQTFDKVTQTPPYLLTA